jgi:mono/diheme cytochrome c family protein
MRKRAKLVLMSIAVSSLTLSVGAASQDQATAGKSYRVVDGKVDARTYNGYRRYHAGCNHCHGQDGIGSSFAPSLVDGLPDAETFRQIVREGRSKGVSVMKGFADDPNFAPYVDDIYAYLQARADGALGRGRPDKLGE